MKQFILNTLQRHKKGWLGLEALQSFQGTWRSVTEAEPPRPLDLSQAKVFAEFVRDDGQRVSLYEGYRNRIKDSWKLGFWPTKALLAIKNRVTLPSQAASLVQALMMGRTLSAPLIELADVVAELQRQYPDVLIESSIICPLTDRNIIAAHLTPKQVEKMAHSYRLNAQARLQKYLYWTNNTALDTVTALETGCGIGYAVAALATFGVGKSMGVDNLSPDVRWIHERSAVLTKMGAGDSPQILPGDLHQLPFDDNAFHFMYSSSVLEHVHDLSQAFREMFRVLKPGGVMIHEADPYFSPKGGHSSCTLDFPWGHARLRPAEFRRYIQEFRPHEYDHTMAMYNTLFNQPRVSLNQIEQAIGNAGLMLLDWKEGKDVTHLPSAEIWQEVSDVYPDIGFRDLTTNFLGVVAMKG